MLTEVPTLLKAQLQSFIQSLIKYLIENRKISQKNKAFVGLQGMTKRELLAMTQKYILRNWKSKKLSDLDIRAIEDLINDISGRKYRDYQHE